MATGLRPVGLCSTSSAGSSAASTGWISGARHHLHDAAAHGDGCRVPAQSARQLDAMRPLVVPAFVGYGDQRAPVHGRHHGARARAGIIDWVALRVIGVPGAFIWGLLAFVCSYIPNIGYFIAIIPPIFFGALVGGWPTVIAVIVVYGVVNGVIQSVIQPRVVGKAVT